MIGAARQFEMLNLSVFDCLEDIERVFYNAYKNTKVSKTDKDNAESALNTQIRSFTGVRSIKAEKIYLDGCVKKNLKIASFENECVRLSADFIYDENNPKILPLILDIAILNIPDINMNSDIPVKENRYEVMMKQIIDNGLIIDKDKYIFYASSTGQQKNRQICLMKEAFYAKHCERLMCGLTLDIINSKGGCNTGKYLAYTSLIFSKSVEPSIPINIDEVIILPEFETLVRDHVNYLTMDDCSIVKKEMDVPVNHMDGAGMFLPGLFPASCQIRGGYIKGAVFPFDFRQFIIEQESKERITTEMTTKDVWGNDVSLGFIRDNIKMILNGSQLKMWKYYDSWEHYKECFKQTGQIICVNNMIHYPDTDNPTVPSAYQFYQTMNRDHVTEERIKALSQKTITMVNDAKENADAALELMGVSKDEAELEPLLASIKRYPELIQTPHVRKRITKMIDSMRSKGMEGKPFIRGYYNYICPDLYAACEYWFCGDQNPEGLIPANTVYNALYVDNGDVTEVCCLRSPHLSDCEHGMREIIRTEECKRWFHGLDTVISTHDLLTKTLQCDCDGDEMLITPDRAFIDMVDRSKSPLYYEMKKAQATFVNNDEIYKCLVASFNNSIIGEISNALTKYLNTADSVDLGFVRVMTAYNNFVIDFPKSQYLPVLTKEYLDMFTYWKDQKYPTFFKYAKNKKKNQCYDEKIDGADVVNRSNVNRISKYIMKFTGKNDKNIWREEDDIVAARFNPQYFQFQNYAVNRKSQEYIKLLNLLPKLKHMEHNISLNDNIEKYRGSKYTDKLSYGEFYSHCASEIWKLFSASYNITEMIEIRKKSAAYLLDIEYLQECYVNDSKNIIWNCFGDILYDNLIDNLGGQKNIRVKRFAYQSNNRKKEHISNMIKEAEAERSTNYEVKIYEDELNWIRNLKCRKGTERDRYVLYILIVLFKRRLAYFEKLKSTDESTIISTDAKSYVKIYINKRNGKCITKATIDNWIGAENIVNKALTHRLNKNGIVKIEECKKAGYCKVYLQIPDGLKISNVERQENELFTVREWNPMFDYYKYTNEAVVKSCEICTRPFIVIGNTKTCGNVNCARMLQKINK